MGIVNTGALVKFFEGAQIWELRAYLSQNLHLGNIVIAPD